MARLHKIAEPPPLQRVTLLTRRVAGSQHGRVRSATAGVSLARPTLIPRVFTDDPEGLVGFLRDVFGGVGEYVAGRPTEVAIGSSILMVSGTDERPVARAFLYVYVPDVDDAYEAALKRNATSVEEPSAQSYGDRRAMIIDAWGNTWQIATPLP